MSEYTDGKDFTTNWFDGYAHLWLEKFGWMRDKPIRALEIGSFEGRSACWMMENLLTHPESTIVCVDTWDGQDKTIGESAGDVAFDRFLRNTQQYGEKVFPMRGSSSIKLSDLVYRGNLFNLIFIDGDHEALAALTDLVMSWRLLSTGGVLIFDDFLWSHPALRAQPGTAWAGFMACRPLVKEIGTLGRSIYCIKES